MTLIVKQLAKQYNQQTIVDNFNLTVDAKEIVCLMGESGVGKSTILRCILGLESCDYTEISLNNQAINSTYYRQNIGFVAQDYQLFPHLTVLNNLVQPALINQVKPEIAKARAKKLLVDFKLADKENSYPQYLSGGQQQRVAIARCLMLPKEIICFDEPTSALDATTILEIKKILQELSQTRGLIIVTHDENFALEIATKIIRLKKA